ncbi:MAG: transketolase family protein [Stellaceae bacterium]
MRNAFADELTKLAAADPSVVLFSGDIGNRMFEDFKAAAPGRFFNCGVAEANMVGMAAGLAMNGLRPVVYTITPFLTYRVIEQIRVDLCYHHVPVVLVGTGSGLRYASLGATHHSLEEMAMLRTLPGMTVLAPADAGELRACLDDALKLDGPVYMRIGKKGEPNLHAARPVSAIGHTFQLRAGPDLCLLGTGVMTAAAIEAADLLAGHGIGASVYSMPTIKPLDGDFLAEVFATYPLVVSVEEHGLIGGFGAAIAEWMADRLEPPRARLLRCGTADRFMHEAGEMEHAHTYFGISSHQIAARIEQRLAARPLELMKERM